VSKSFNTRESHRIVTHKEKSEAGKCKKVPGVIIGQDTRQGNTEVLLQNWCWQD